MDQRDHLIFRNRKKSGYEVRKLVYINEYLYNLQPMNLTAQKFISNDRFLTISETIMISVNLADSLQIRMCIGYNRLV